MALRESSSAVLASLYSLEQSCAAKGLNFRGWEGDDAETCIPPSGVWSACEAGSKL
jgi:hypothetical protein